MVSIVIVNLFRCQSTASFGYQYGIVVSLITVKQTGCFPFAVGVTTFPYLFDLANLFWIGRSKVHFEVDSGNYEFILFILDNHSIGIFGIISDT